MDGLQVAAGNRQPGGKTHAEALLQEDTTPPQADGTQRRRGKTRGHGQKAGVFPGRQTMQAGQRQAGLATGNQAGQV